MTEAGDKPTRRRAIAYLINQYPKVSHSFIRREILALERAGVVVQRYAVRGWEGDLPDAADMHERANTRYLLRLGIAGIIGPTLRVFIMAPRRFVAALALACRLGRCADRPLAYHLVYLAQACLLFEWLRASGASHLHAHFGTNPAELALLAHALGGPPYSFTVHGPEEFDKPEALHLREKIRRAAFVVAISSYGRSQLYRWTEFEQWANIMVVHCGLDAGFHADKVVDAPTSVRLVCVGRLCEQKGQMLLVEAAHSLIKRGCAIELVFAGDGEMRAEIEALVEQLEMTAHVRITGWISSADVRDEILASRALVLPSFAEGLPVVIMEAMALRRPVISTYVAGIPELVQPGTTGWLVAAGDAISLAGAIEECLTTPSADLERMGAAAHARVLERHDVDLEAKKLASLFAASDRAASTLASETP